MKRPSATPIRNFIVGICMGAGLLGILGVKLGTLASAQAGELWTTKPPSSAHSASDASADVMKLNQAFTHLAETMSPAVVNIYTKTGLGSLRAHGLRRQPFDQGSDEDFEFFFGNPFEGGRGAAPREAQALGSGFVINTDGTIVTNAHVVRLAGHNADEIMIKFIGEDKSTGHKAQIIGVDEATDVAVLKLVERKSGLQVAPLGDSDRSKVGEWVFAIGNPYGHSNTLTQGIVSALGRSLEGTRMDFIQTSASINPGNSGGPLINLAGEVIGINAAIDPRAQGIGFAIPINSAKTVISDLINHGHVSRPWMGLAIQDVSDDVKGAMKLKSSDGVLVREVVPNQPAARAGIEAYDVIKKVNGQEIKSSHDLMRTIEGLAIGQTADVEVVRENRVHNLKVQVSEQPSKT